MKYQLAMMMMILSKSDQNLMKNYRKWKRKQENSQVLFNTTPSDFLVMIIVIAIVKKKCETFFFSVDLVGTSLAIHYLLRK